MIDPLERTLFATWIFDSPYKTHYISYFVFSLLIAVLFATRLIVYAWMRNFREIEPAAEKRNEI